MDGNWWQAIVTAFLAALAGLFGWLQFRAGLKLSRVAALEARVACLERELETVRRAEAQCQTDKENLKATISRQDQKNQEMLTKIVLLQNQVIELQRSKP